MKKVAMVSVDYLPNIGGITEHIRNLSKQLPSYGFEPIIINAVNAELGLPLLESRDNIEIIRPQFKWGNSQQSRMIYRSISIYNALKALRVRYGDDLIVHQHDYLSSSIATRFVKGKKIWTNHSSSFLKDFDESNLTRIKIGHGFFDKIITVSPEIQEKTMLALPKSHPQFIANGVDENHYKYDPNTYSDDQSFVVFCPRRIVEKNGIRYLAQAISKLSNESKERFEFIFVGDEPSINTDGRLIGEIKNMLANLSTNIVVSYMGNVDSYRMKELYKRAHLVVIPSLVEAVSLSALEAMASGVPVLATNIGGLPIIISDNKTGKLIPAMNSNAIKEAILEIKHNYDFYSKCAESANSNVRANFTWSNIAKMTAATYASL